MGYAFYSGKLREAITIRRKGEGKNDTTGGLRTGWATLADNLAAEVISLNGREALIGGVLQGVSFFKITVRYRTDLKASDQILWNGRELNIISAEDELGTRQWTVIQASTAAPEGA
jgi:SPP1 family predicted phage head-tail adaptor